jgi:hypothetical protein
MVAPEASTNTVALSATCQARRLRCAGAAAAAVPGKRETGRDPDALPAEAGREDRPGDDPPPERLDGGRDEGAGGRALRLNSDMRAVQWSDGSCGRGSGIGWSVARLKSGEWI